MLYSELKDLTKGECTYEEYEAVNAVYMSLDDMTKQDAAKLWKKLYNKRHVAAKKEKQRKSHDANFIYNLMRGAFNNEERVLPNGDVIKVKYNVQAPNGVMYASFYLVKNTVKGGCKEVYIGRDNFAESIVIADDNPYKLTK